MKKLIIIACCMLMGCGFGFIDGSTVTAVSQHRNYCEYSVRFLTRNNEAIDNKVACDCGKFQIGDTLYLTKTK